MSKSYDVYLHPNYLKIYQKLKKNNPKAYNLIKKGLNELKIDPFNKKNKILKNNWAGYRRIKIGDYRIIYEIIFNEQLNTQEINVLKFGHRRNVYNKSYIIE